MLEAELMRQDSPPPSEDWDLIADLNDEDIEDDSRTRQDKGFCSIGYQDMDFPPLTSTTGNSCRPISSSSRISSYPEMGSFSYCNESESVVSGFTTFEDISSDVTCTSDAPVLVDFPSSTNSCASMPVVKKMSFKDMMMLNAEKRIEEPEPTKKTSCSTNTKQKKFSPKFVVRPIKRNAHSTGELPRLAEVDDAVELGGGGGSCGGAGLATVKDGEVLGATDAEDFYARKNHGAKTHRNGLRCRPDEAKRKEFSQHKRAMQKEAQRARGR